MDIHVAVMTMAKFRMQPRVGHLKQIERIFSFLKQYPGSAIKFRTDPPNYENFEKSTTADWTYVYGDTAEELPPKMLKPKGKPVTISAFCNANLYHNHTTGRAVTGVIMMLNKTPIEWTSKKQSTVETATYGSEIIASRIAVDQIVEWRYTLHILGVPLIEDGGIAPIWR